MNYKEEGISIKAVLIFLALMFVLIHLTTGPVWHAGRFKVKDKPIFSITTDRSNKSITITSDKPVVVNQYVKEVVRSSGFGVGAGAWGSSSSSKSKVSHMWVIKIQKLE
jgi:hypothetical protein